MGENNSRKGRVMLEMRPICADYNVLIRSNKSRLPPIPAWYQSNV